MHSGYSIAVHSVMSSAKSSKPVSIGSLILPLTGRRAQEELNINCIGAAPTAEGWLGTLMNTELLRALYEGNPIGDGNVDSEDQFWLKSTGMDYDIWPLLQNEKWAKKWRAIFTWPYLWVIKSYCYRSWRGGQQLPALGTNAFLLPLGAELLTDGH